MRYHRFSRIGSAKHGDSNPWSATRPPFFMDLQKMKNSRWIVGLLAIGLLAMLTTDVLAQRGGGRGGQGGPGGRFGGGGPGGRGGGGDMTMGLLRIEAVREEIELMPDQSDALKKLEEQQQSQRGERPDFDFRNASEEEREKFFEEQTKKREEAAKKTREQLEEVLFPEQMERLDQIAIQLQGVGALGTEKVQEALKITDAQKEKLAEVQSAMRDKMGTMMREMFQNRGQGGDGGGFDRDAMREKMTEAREEVEKEILGVLTSDQKKKFEEMKGEKFEMPEGQRFGFGGGRGGPGGFGGGRGGPGGDRGGRGGGDRGGRGGRPQSE